LNNFERLFFSLFIYLLIWKLQYCPGIGLVYIQVAIFV